MSERLKLEVDSSSAVNIANEILQSTYVMNSLPTSLLDIIELFLKTLQDSVAPGTKETVLKALGRVLIHYQQDDVICTLVPLLLDPLLSIRIQSSICLLECLKTTPTQIWRNHCMLITKTFSIALSTINSNLTFTASSSNALRLISTCLQIYNIILNDDGTALSPEIVHNIIANVAIYIYYRPGVGGNTTPVIGRVRSVSGASLSFGVMASFAPSATSSPKKKAAGIIRSSSISSMSGLVSESDDEIIVPTDKKYTSAEIRAEALVVLNNIAQKDPKLLFSHWSHFFSDSPYLRSHKTLLNTVETDPASHVRLKACQTLNSMLTGSAPYLAIAEDRPTKASFTSLSSRLGEIVSELHLKLASLLSTPSSSNSPDLRIVILQVSSTLGLNSPYMRMKRSLAEPLIKSILPYLDNLEEKISIAACTALQSILANLYGGIFISPQVLDLMEIGIKVIQILEATKFVMLRSNLYGVLAIIIIKLPNLDILPALNILKQEYDSASSSDLETRIAFVASIFKPGSLSFELKDFSKVLLATTEKAISSARPSSRVFACNILSSHTFETLRSSIDIYGKLSALVQDSDSGVRSAACRSLGLLVKSTSFRPDLLSAIMRLLLACCDAVETKGAASWSFANCCDILISSGPQAINISEWVDLALQLTSSSNSEKIRTNGIRALGSLLRVSNISSATSSDDISRMISALCEGNRVGGSAKLRWNSSAAIGNALLGEVLSSNPSTISPSSTTSPALSLLRHKLIRSLSATLIEDGNFKVRIQAVNSLLVLNTRDLFGDEFSDVSDKINLAIERLQEEQGMIPPKEKDHSEQLSQKLSQCSMHLQKIKTKH